MNTTYGRETGQSAGSLGAYPVTVEYPGLEYYNKTYAVPVLGILLKAIMLIPFYIAVYIMGIIVNLAMLVSWVPVLFVGQYPSFAYTLYGGMIRWYVRMYAFATGLQDKYPSFSFNDEPGMGDSTFSFVPNENPSKLYAVPIVGMAIKVVMLIPHAIVLGVLGFVCSLAMLVTWIPVLTSGRYPSWGLTLIGGTLRWYARVMAFMFGITDSYPPFSLS